MIDLATAGISLTSAVIGGAIVDQTGRRLDSDAFEKALAEVVLFGNEQEIQLVSRIMDEFVANHTSDTTELLKLLRRNIRRELGLQQTRIEFRWLRVRQYDGSPETEAIKVEDASNVPPTQPVPSPLVGPHKGGGNSLGQSATTIARPNRSVGGTP